MMFLFLLAGKDPDARRALKKGALHKERKQHAFTRYQDRVRQMRHENCAGRHGTKFMLPTRLLIVVCKPEKDWARVEISRRDVLCFDAMIVTGFISSMQGAEFVIKLNSATLITTN